MEIIEFQMRETVVSMKTLLTGLFTEPGEECRA